MLNLEDHCLQQELQDGTSWNTPIISLDFFYVAWSAHARDINTLHYGTIHYITVKYKSVGIHMYMYIYIYIFKNVYTYLLSYTYLYIHNYTHVYSYIQTTNMFRKRKQWYIDNYRYIETTINNSWCLQFTSIPATPPLGSSSGDVASLPRSVDMFGMEYSFHADQHNHVYIYIYI